MLPTTSVTFRRLSLRVIRFLCKILPYLNCLLLFLLQPLDHLILWKPRSLLELLWLDSRWLLNLPRGKPFRLLKRCILLKLALSRLQRSCILLKSTLSRLQRRLVLLRSTQFRLQQRICIQLNSALFKLLPEGCIMLKWMLFRLLKRSIPPSSTLSRRLRWRN